MPVLVVMSPLTLVFVLYVGIVSTRRLLNKTDTEMISCIKTIINDYVERRTVVFYVEEEDNNFLWQKLLRDMDKPFMIISKGLQLCETDKLLLVLFPKPDTVYTGVLKRLRKDTLYIIVTDGSFDWYETWDILGQFHNTNMIYDILLIPKEDKINIYTSFPYSDKHCAEVGPPTKIEQYADGEFKKKINLFHTGKYWNMYGCTLTCLGVRQPPDATLALGKNGEMVFQGITKELMDTLSEKLNFKPNIILPQGNNSSLERLWFFYNDTVDEITNYLRNGQADFAMGVFSRLAFTNDSAVLFGKETRFECYTFAVPIRAGKKRSVVKNYIDEFTLSFWILFIISLIIAVFIIVSITTILKENTHLQHPLNAFLYLFATVMNQTFPVKPKPWSLRLFIAHWLVYVLIVTTAYQASLWSFMTIPWQVQNIRSLQDLLDSSLEIRGAQHMLKILKSIQSNNENVKEMIRRFKVVHPSDFNEIMQRIETKRDLAVFGERAYLSSYSRDMKKGFYTDSVYFVDECLMQSLMTLLLFPSGSPLYDPINSMLIRLLQNGLIQKYSNEYSGEKLDEKGTINSRREMKQKTGGMTLTQCQGIFIILLFGYGLSFAVFTCEVLYFNFIRKSNKVNVIQGPKLYYRDM